jgi:hypothetical protein
MRLWILFCFILLLSVIGSARLRADLNGDCRVDFADLVILMSEWMLEEDCEMALGPELVVNGGFDSDTSWAKTGFVTISGGKCTIGNFVGTSILQQEIAVFEAKTYTVSVNILTLVKTSGIVVFELAGNDHSITETGIQDWNITTTVFGNSFITVLTGLTPGESVSFDNISVREVLPDGGGFIGQNIFEEME